jgi:thiamine pyrophosphate-dependent acetolactate synthase large subunit-like protein
MRGFEIIQELSSLLSGDEVIVSSNGNISRQVFHYCQQPQVYLRGSMGLPISVGLGLALSRPTKQILVVLGDGNLLMGMGSLSTVSLLRPPNLKVLVLDNQVYATTGNQRTSSRVLNYTSLLSGLGVPIVGPVQINDTTEHARVHLLKLLNTSEICVLPALVESEPPTLANIPLHPEEITALQMSKHK